MKENGYVVQEYKVPGEKVLPDNGFERQPRIDSGICKAS